MNKIIVLLFTFLMQLISTPLCAQSVDPAPEIKINYVYSDEYNNVYHGEIANNQDINLLMFKGYPISITIKNMGTMDLILFGDDPVQILENIPYFIVIKDPDTIIPPGKSSTFSIIYNPDMIFSWKSTIILIKTNDPGDEDFQFGLWGWEGYGGGSW
jgi:hypothetical protein